MSSYQLTIQKTNDVSIIKFVANKILTQGSFEFSSIEEANKLPFAQQILNLPFIKKVYITANFIALEKYAMVEWDEVQTELKQIIEDSLNANNGITLLTNEIKIPVEVYAESTPNPIVMKYATNKLLSKFDVEFKNINETNNAPFVQFLFGQPYIKSIFISQNYISITKTDSFDWLEINTEIRNYIKNYLDKGENLFTDDFEYLDNNTIQNTTHKPANDSISQKIIEILDEYIKPAVAADGGNIIFSSYNVESKTVNVILKGACSGCPSSTITLKNGIENTLRQLLPEHVESIVAINQ